MYDNHGMTYNYTGYMYDKHATTMICNYTVYMYNNHAMICNYTVNRYDNYAVIEVNDNNAALRVVRALTAPRSAGTITTPGMPSSK